MPLLDLLLSDQNQTHERATDVEAARNFHSTSPFWCRLVAAPETRCIYSSYEIGFDAGLLRSPLMCILYDFLEPICCKVSPYGR
jgi:hypothetical protein